MNEVKNKLMKRERKGFTLMEMLIVVAIIAVLVAIAIPVFMGQLNKAKEAADEANARSLFALVTADKMTSTEGTLAGIGEGNSVKDATVTYTVGTGTDATVNTFKFSDVATTLTVNKDANPPTVTLVTNGVTYSFPATN